MSRSISESLNILNTIYIQCQYVTASKLKLSVFRTLVLDEADKLVDESFYTQVKCLASQLPTSKQVLAMSATYHKVSYFRNDRFLREGSGQGARF